MRKLRTVQAVSKWHTGECVHGLRLVSGGLYTLEESGQGVSQSASMLGRITLGGWDMSASEQVRKPGLMVRRRSAEAKADETNPKDVAETPGVSAAEPDASALLAPVPVAETPTDDTRSRPPERSSEQSAHSPSTPAKPSPADLEVSFKKEGPPPSKEDFAALFESTQVEIRSYAPGDQVTARIHTLTDSEVFLDLGGKMEGMMELSELRDRDGALTAGVGDEVKGWVVGLRGGTIQISRGLSRQSAGLEALETAHAERIPVEGRVDELNKGGFVVDVLGARAFCPLSQIEIGSTEEPAVHVGATYRFLVERVEEGGRNVVVSRAALQRREREQALAELLERLRVGDEVDGVVTRLAAFGAFVELAPGVEGLVHVSELSHGRVERPEEVISLGERVRVAVLQIQQGSSSRDLRISLSLKALQGDPFEAAALRISIGQTVQGVITRLAPFGAFVEVAPNVEGLVHISELGTGRRINHPREVVQEGQNVEVQVLDVDPIKRQFKLSMQASAGDPWLLASGQLPVGSRVQGVVASVEGFGAFIDLPQGVTGLVPLGEMNEDERQHPQRRFPVGSTVEVFVAAVDVGRRRLTLSTREPEESVTAADLARVNATASLGTLADAFRKWKKKS